MKMHKLTKKTLFVCYYKMVFITVEKYKKERVHTINVGHRELFR